MFAAIKNAKAARDEIVAFNDTCRLVRYMMLGNAAESAEIARAEGCSERMVKALELTAKSAVHPATTTGVDAGGSGWGGALVSTTFGQTFIPELLVKLRNSSAFAAARSDMIQVPMLTNVPYITASITAARVLQSAGKPIKRFTYANASLPEANKFAPLVVLTNEILRHSPDLAVQMIARELQAVAGVALDTYFLQALDADSLAFDSNQGASFAGMLADFNSALRVLTLGSTSKVYAVVTPEMMKLLGGAAVLNAVQTLNYNGGSLMGMRVIVSDAQAANSLTVFDATGIVFGEQPISVRRSDEAAIQMDDATTQNVDTPTATTLTSLFQTNSTAVMVEGALAVKVVRPNSVVNVQNTSWLSDESPIP